MRLTLYTRSNCHLCEEAHAALERLRARGLRFELTLEDVDAQPELTQRYGSEVPVLLVEGRKFAKFRIDEARLLRRLAAG